MPLAVKCWQQKSLDPFSTPPQPCQGAITRVYGCILIRKSPVCKSNIHVIKFRSLIWIFGTKNRISPVTAKGALGGHQLTPCRWAEKHRGHTGLPRSETSFSSLNKHCGKQLWRQPITIKQQNYVCERVRELRIKRDVSRLESAPAVCQGMAKWNRAKTPCGAFLREGGGQTWCFPETEADWLWIEVRIAIKRFQVEICMMSFHAAKAEPEP